MTVFDIVDSQLKELETATGYNMDKSLWDDFRTTGIWHKCVVEIRRAMEHYGFEYSYKFVYTPRWQIKHIWSLDGEAVHTRLTWCDEGDYFYPELTFALQTVRMV